MPKNMEKTIFPEKIIYLREGKKKDMPFLSYLAR